MNDMNRYEFIWIYMSWYESISIDMSQYESIWIDMNHFGFLGRKLRFTCSCGALESMTEDRKFMRLFPWVAGWDKYPSPWT